MPKLTAAPSALAAPPHRLGFASKQEAERARFRHRNKTRMSRRWYNSERWRVLRLAILERDSYICQATGILLCGRAREANSPIVDHRVPHRDDPALFWDPDNLWAVSKAWHDKEKQRLERAAGSNDPGVG